VIGGAGSWAQASAAHAREAAPSVSYRVGDDVAHAAFGDGVVIALEPGGIVLVRFAGDRSERKLLDNAPMSRR
jgi:DNA helicase-2/ATP-dependent DNA helicase PcrA